MRLEICIRQEPFRSPSKTFVLRLMKLGSLMGLTLPCLTPMMTRGMRVYTGSRRTHGMTFSILRAKLAMARVPTIEEEMLLRSKSAGMLEAVMVVVSSSFYFLYMFLLTSSRACRSKFLSV